ncbi:hypothetical protein V0288_23735 [Pannus brasiliensis CCIBt3594]|uniref:Ribbon-helix-helix protein CopG domain-containing protein n=1 Tax=Pannus brasiliensis CCIBt3594 TaxID=1427578 RepID=A0AAW9QQV8_9CHRO
MGKVGKILSTLEKETAIANGVPLTTVYKRLGRGWDVADAITRPSRSLPPGIERDDVGEFAPAPVVRGRGRSTRLPIELDPQLDAAIEASGKSQSDFIADILVEWLGSQQKAPAPRGSRREAG